MHRKSANEIRTKACAKINLITLNEPNRPIQIKKPKPKSSIKLPKLKYKEFKSSKREFIFNTISNLSSHSPKLLPRSSIDSLWKSDSSRFISLLSPKKKSIGDSLLKMSNEKTFKSTKQPLVEKKLEMQGIKINPKVKHTMLKSLRIETPKKEQTVLQIKKSPESDSSYSSTELENDIKDVSTTESTTINPIFQKKFDSPFVRQQSSKRTSVGSLISEISIRTLQSIKSTGFNREATIENIIDELKNTPSVSIFNDLKFKLITQDPLIEGINGIIIK